MKKTRKNNIIDLASGGGGGMLKIARQLKPENPSIKILLTDFNPNIPAFQCIVKNEHSIFNYHPKPVDAGNVPADLDGLRTMFLSFHHFRSEKAKNILQDSLDKGMPILIVEIQQRNFISLVPMILSPLNVLLTTPFIRPFRIGRILFTYLIPVLPLTILWDGIVSVLRTYTKDELIEMTEQLYDSSSFIWETGLTRTGPGGVFFLTGFKRS